MRGGFAKKKVSREPFIFHIVVNDVVLKECSMQHAGGIMREKSFDNAVSALCERGVFKRVESCLSSRRAGRLAAALKRERTNERTNERRRNSRLAGLSFRELAEPSRGSSIMKWIMAKRNSSTLLVYPALPILFLAFFFYYYCYYYYVVFSLVYFIFLILRIAGKNRGCVTDSERACSGF